MKLHRLTAVCFGVFAAGVAASDNVHLSYQGL